MEFLPIQFTKMSGAGNTFALLLMTEQVAALWKKNKTLSRTALAKKICDKIKGVHVDGLLILEKTNKDFDYVWDFYNSDGSQAEMCGNAARCAAYFCFDLVENKKKSEFDFLTGAGPVHAQVVSENDIVVQMPPLKILNKNCVLNIQGKEEKFFHVNTGVPHLVYTLPLNQGHDDLRATAQKARTHAQLLPAGANVTFYTELSEGKIKAVTYERGVEDFTLACGTGAVAAAALYFDLHGAKEVTVQMPGGELQVQAPQQDSRPLLRGSAVVVGNFYYSTEVFNEKF